MSERIRSLTRENVDGQIEWLLASVERMGNVVANASGLGLLRAIKRDTVKAGPYPNVSLFEAANRIMTDLVILYGVRWLLHNSMLFPFDSYTVEYGHENRRAHDVMAEQGGKTLIGEAFNVAPSFYRTKKNSTLHKLGKSKVKADYKVVLVNDDAMEPDSEPELVLGVSLIVVKVGSTDVRYIERSLI
jgi:hypothetical protein